MCGWKGIFSGQFFRHDDPPTEVRRCFAYYIFKTWARHDRLLPILCCRKNLKAQCKEYEVPMQFILHPVTSNSY